jgi:hypothetical protein
VAEQIKLLLYPMECEEGREWRIVEPEMIGWLQGLLMCTDASTALHLKV